MPKMTYDEKADRREAETRHRADHATDYALIRLFRLILIGLVVMVLVQVANIVVNAGVTRRCPPCSSAPAERP